MISRREFFQKTAAGAAAMSVVAAQVARLKANPLGLPMGSQTYPFRTRIEAGEFAALVKDFKMAGVDVIELCDPIGYVRNNFGKLADGKATRKVLDDNGVRAVSCHVDMPVYRQHHSETLDWAHLVGLEMLSTADLGGKVTSGVTTEDEVKRAADEYNKIAAVSKKAGFQQILHNEGFANSRLDDGRLTYPVLLHYLDPDLVKMQFQMSSMTTLGDPIAYFTNYPGRFASAHLQPVDTTQGVRGPNPQRLPVKGEAPAGRRGGAGGGGTRAGAPGGAAPPAPSAIGEDNADWPRIFAAGKIGGLKYAFVEVNNWDQMVRSVAYLKTLS